jgi:predicted hydrolase (HD superfamily)
MDVMDRDETLEFLSRHVKTGRLMKPLFSVEAVWKGDKWWGVAGIHRSAIAAVVTRLPS